MTQELETASFIWAADSANGAPPPQTGPSTGFFAGTFLGGVALGLVTAGLVCALTGPGDAGGLELQPAG